jgi:hypothetical protein
MTNRTSLLFVSLPLLVLPACGGNVHSDGSGGTSSGSSSSSSTGSGSSSSGSTGSGSGGSSASSSSGSGGSGTGGSSGVTSSSSSSSSSGSATCMGSVDLVVGGTAVHLTSDCAAETWHPSTTAVGYVTQGGPAPGVSNLNVFGCVSDTAGSQGISITVPGVTGPGTFTDGTANYTAAGGATSSDMAGLKVVVTTMGVVGDTITGTLTGALTHPPSQIAVSITGTFSVCRVEDEDVP